MTNTQNGVDQSTLFLADLIKSRGISLKKVAEVTDISYNMLYNSLGSRKINRSLRADELIKVCDFLGYNLTDLANTVLDKGA